jgi:hypothetical protein
MIEIYDNLYKVLSVIESIKITNELIASTQQHYGEYHSESYCSLQSVALDVALEILNDVLNKIDTQYIQIEMDEDSLK